MALNPLPNAFVIGAFTGGVFGLAAKFIIDKNKAAGQFVGGIIGAAVGGLAGGATGAAIVSTTIGITSSGCAGSISGYICGHTTAGWTYEDEEIPNGKNK
ncbi:unnamed protein product [Adineta steineri]|uniref:Uncharacterized protein n=1 Tax=Adineta steineri TaxID=433720 RepID=A0A814EY15_9BILA|nr:unnamed protein product [Adineta steineri]CAF3529499.1 unnamed protein product [Adineta steineri]